jgi:dUTP pyrophosphatase
MMKLDLLLVLLVAFLAMAYRLILYRSKKPKRVLWTATKDPGSWNLGYLHAPKYEGDAGYDLAISDPTTLEPNKLTRVPCGIRIALPDGVSTLVVPRSSSVTQGILVFSTLIDSGYRGPLFVFCYNLSSEYIHLNAGMRIAQLLPVPNIPMPIQEVEEELLPSSHRGNNGFGSTGGSVNGHTTS